MQHVNVARGDAIVLHDINLTIRSGEHVAILGPNGCGKSTLIKTITRECYPMVAQSRHMRLRRHSCADCSGAPVGRGGDFWLI